MMYFLTLCASILALCGAAQVAPGRWSVDRAQKWYREKGWRAGANFVPSDASNQLEMFQAETYNPELIDKELQYAENIGFTALRVYLHDLLWFQDSEAFLNRIDHFLGIAEKHKMEVMLVLFDSCWNANPKLGKQPEPIFGVHNSQWVQSPGLAFNSDPIKFDELQEYVEGVVEHFKDDKRILAWDLWNEPTNSNYTEHTMIPLVSKVFQWVRAVDPSQPLTTPVWESIDVYNYTALQKLQMDNSDVITFHSYQGIVKMSQGVFNLKQYSPGRPIICTEYLARPDSTFDPILGFLKNENVMAINWGLVTGRSNAMYNWDTIKV